MNTRMLTIWLCVVCVSLPAAGQYPLAGRVPAESFGYVGWAGRSLTFDGSMLGQMLNEPMLATIVETLREALVERMPEEILQRQAVEHAFDIVLLAWQHPIAVAVLPPAEDGPPTPTPMLIIDLGEDRESFAESLASLLTAAGVETEELPVGPLTCQVIQTPGPPVMFGYAENLLVVTLNPELILRISELTEADSLATNEQFCASMDVVDGDDVQAAFYMDFAALRETINGLLPPAPAEEEGSVQTKWDIFNSEGIEGFWRAMGLDETTVIAGTMRIVDRQFHTKVRVFSPAPHRGYLMLLAGKAITDADLAGVPADADLLAVANISPTEVMVELRRAIDVLDPAGQEGESLADEFEKTLVEFEEQFGFSLENDLLASLGDTWTVCSAASQGGFLTGTVLSVEVTDPDKLAEVIAAIEELSGPSPVEEETEEPTHVRSKSFRVETMQVGQTEVHYLAGGFDGIASPIAPAWAIHEGRVHFAMWPQVLVTVFQRESVEPLAEDPQFLEYRGKVAADPSMLVYMNTPAIARQLYGWVLMGGTMGTNALAGAGIPADPCWVPSLAAIEKYISPEISAVSSDEDGITMENVSSVPFIARTQVAIPGMLAAGVLPAVSRAREQAYRAASMSNLRGLAVAYMAYEMDNMSAPEDLAALVSAEYITTDMLRCPHNKDAPPTWEEGELVGESDYVYIRPTSEENPGERVLFYERPEHYSGQGTVVAFLDGHVEFLTMDEFQEALDYTNAANATEGEHEESGQSTDDQ